MTHPTNIRAPTCTTALSGEINTTSVALTPHSLDSVSAQSRAVGLRHIFPGIANLGQHLAALVARLIGANAISCESPCLQFDSQFHRGSFRRCWMVFTQFLRPTFHLSGGIIPPF